jgi:hypothetical protein
MARVHPHNRNFICSSGQNYTSLQRMNAATFRFSVTVQQLPEAAHLPSSTTELLLGLQPRLRLPALQGGRRPLREAALGLLHPRAVPALQPVAVTIRELSVPPPCAATRGRPASPLLQVDLPVPDDRALDRSHRFSPREISPRCGDSNQRRRAARSLKRWGGGGGRERKARAKGEEGRGLRRGREKESSPRGVVTLSRVSRPALGTGTFRFFASSEDFISPEARFWGGPSGRGISLSLGSVSLFLSFSFFLSPPTPHPSFLCRDGARSSLLSALLRSFTNS